VDRLVAQGPRDKEILDLSKKLSDIKKSADKVTLLPKTELRFSDQSFQIEPLRMIEQFGQRMSLDK